LEGDYFVGLSFALLCHVILNNRYFFPARSLIHPTQPSIRKWPAH